MSPPRRKRILLLAPFPPRHDAAHGGGRSLAGLVSHLGRRHAVALLSLRAEDEPPVDEEVRRRCEIVEEYAYPTHARTPADRWRRRLRRVRALATGTPIWAAETAVSELSERVATLAREWADIIHVEFQVMTQHARPDGRVPLLLTVHEPAAAAAGELARRMRGPAWIVHALDALAWRRFEAAAIARVDLVVVFTERDRANLAPLSKTPIARVPLQLEVPEVPLDPAGDGSDTILFVGNFGHPPNREAAIRLVDRIYPRIRARRTSARLVLVGDQPPAAAADAGEVVATGRVPDVTPYLDRAAVVVAPLSSGGGQRVKVMEALASGKAVVATPLAVEGLEIVPGQQALVADTDDEIAEAVLGLLGDAERRVALGRCARKWACRNLDWEKSVSGYEELYDRLVSRESPPFQAGGPSGEDTTSR